MLVLKLDLAAVNLALDIHKFVESLENISQTCIRFGIDVITKFKSGLLNWLDIEQVEADTAENIIDLLLILILGGDNNLLVKVIDTDDITDESLQGSLEPVNPRTVCNNLKFIVIEHVYTGHVAVQV